ncbi:DUF1566 domain-containing protein, partial [candidate division KSB1 bacterium]|nr:DUF1566 domain-containing protein [candidate division KSB1 bacterium]
MKKFSLLFYCLFFLIFFNPLHAELVDNGNGTITDTNTGLMWLKNANLAGETMTWEEANAWANNLRYAGYEDWRLPSGENPDGTVCNSRSGGVNCTQTEFWSLYGVYLITVFSPSPFTNIGYRTYWTATEWPSNTANAMAQDMEDGGQNDFSKTSTLYAWAVRGGSQPPDIDAPTSLTALANYDAAIPLAWKAPNSPNLNGYDIYRSTSSGGSFNRIASNVVKTYYRDNSVDNGRTYYYKIKAVYDAGVSGFSNTAHAKAVSAG